MSGTIKNLNCLAMVDQGINQFDASNLLTSRQAINCGQDILIDALVSLVQPRNCVSLSINLAAENPRPSYPEGIRDSFGWPSPQSLIAYRSALHTPQTPAEMMRAMAHPSLSSWCWPTAPFYRAPRCRPLRRGSSPPRD